MTQVRQHRTRLQAAASGDAQQANAVASRREVAMQGASIFGEWANAHGGEDSVSADPEEVVRRFIRKMGKRFEDFDMTSNPVDFFKDGDLSSAVPVALDLLAVPADEAPAERIFSIPSRIIGNSRVSMSPTTVCQTTFLKKKNKRAFEE